MVNVKPTIAGHVTRLGLTIAISGVAPGDMIAQPAHDESRDLSVGSQGPGSYVISALLLPSRTALLKSKHDDQVLETPLEVGGSVVKGQLLVRLMDEEQRVMVKRARAMLEEAERDLERIRKLRAQGSVSEEALQDSETEFQLIQADFEIARIRLEERSIRAPFDGVVAARYVDPGTSVEIGDPLVRITALSPLWLEALLPEEFLSQVERGTWVSVAVSHPDTALFLFVTPEAIVVDPASGTFPLRIAVDNGHRRLIPGVRCQIVLNGSREPEP